MKKILSIFLCALMVLSYTTVFGAESDSDGIKVLIPHEDHIVRSVWKNGYDMRVCIENSQGLHWYSYRDGVVGEPVGEPEGITYTHAWDDIEEYMLGTGSNTDTFYTLALNNRYPWQCTWNGYYLRMMEFSHKSGGQLWLTCPGQEPRVLAEGNYSYPMVVPGTDFAVASKRVTGGNIIVKIDLITGEETALWNKPEQYNTPFLMLGGKLLIAQGAGGPRYLWDPETDEITSVPEDFPRMYVGEYYRYLQPAGGEGLYYFTDTDTKGGTTLGIVDTINMVFTPMMVFERMYLSPMDVWVDEENACLYYVDNGDLMQIPFSLGKPEPDFIRVWINGVPIDYTGIVTDDGRTHIDISGNHLGYLGIVTAMNYNYDTSIVIRNQKAYVLQNGCDYITEVDFSGVTDFDAFSADLQSGNPYEKSYVRTIPIDTKVIYGYIPLRAVCEAIGAEVEWNSEEGCIDIYVDYSGVEWYDTEYIKNYFITYIELILNVEAWKGAKI